MPTQSVAREVPASSETQGSWSRLAGGGGLLFVALLVLQNVLRGVTQPANDAPSADLLEFLTDKAWVVHITMFTFVAGAPALLLFTVGLMRAATAKNRAAEPWAQIGVIGVTMVTALFALVNATQVAMVAASDHLAGNEALLRVAWNLHTSVFVLNQLGVGIALFGLSRAAAGAGLLPMWLGRLAIGGSVLLAISTVPAVAIVDGSPVLVTGLVGFLCWLVFLVGASIRLWRE